MAKNRTLYIVIGCDTDPDRRGFLNGDIAEGRSWRGLEEGIPLFKELSSDVKDDQGQPPRITWLVRVDEQIRLLYGDFGWALKRYNSFWKELESGGDELGWHPHFYGQDEKSGRWYQVIDDPAWQSEMLAAAYHSYQSVFPGRARSVRMGWDYHNNTTMRKLDQLGVSVDFSALPGLKTRAAREKTRSYNVFDWHISPRDPYFPSGEDYRRSPRNSEKALGILELPIYTSPSPIWGLISGLQMTRKMGDPSHLFRAIRRPAYTINITGRPSLFAPVISGLRNLISKQRDIFFATYFHADELLDNKGSIYSRQNFLANTLSLLKLCQQSGIGARFIKASEAKTLFETSNSH